MLQIEQNAREDKSVHHHHRKKIFRRTFLASKKNFPGRWWIQKTLIKTRKSMSTTEIFPLWTPFFPAKKTSALEQGGVCFLFPRNGIPSLDRVSVTGRAPLKRLGLKAQESNRNRKPGTVGPILSGTYSRTGTVRTAFQF